MKNVFNVKNFSFPYTEFHFPGMNSGEKILFITRESPIMLTIRRIMISLIAMILFILGGVSLRLLESTFPFIQILYPLLLILVSLMFFGGFWWVGETYRKSIFVITTRRLTKIIYTTPLTKYQFSLGLDEIADTGSYSSTYFEALFGLGYFVARSGAAAIKNFKIVNISFADDLHNYVNKLLYAFKHTPEKINDFRPFIPYMKGEVRKRYLEDYPQYKTEF